MKKVLLSVFLFSSVNLIFSQELFTEIQGKKVDYFINIEKNLKSKLFTTDTNFISFDDSAQPIIYRRKEKNIPDLLVYYTFSKKDSIVKKILYEWDVYNFDKSDNNVKPEKFSKALIEKYNSLLQIFTNKYGKSEVQGNLNNVKKIDSPEGLKRKDIWEPNKSLEIIMYTSISNYYKKEGIATINPTHRIRLYIKNIKEDTEEDVEPVLDDENIIISNQNFENFIAKLKENQFTEAKSFLSEEILQTTTDDKFIKLRGSINFDNKLVRFLTGIEFTATGESCLMIQYKYDNDPSEVPTSIIKVLFNNENKILAIQPLQLQRKKL
ncbi:MULTISPECIES: hypothetical protein [unclassified Flavobacterium]|jgi:hypothetical protein|uniref:hypothetical protein n=1 Tax=unclassified Flavobacterium TaxID=196869 RepID=UPI00057E4588|nr:MULTISPECIES: hypothetical protein [unclassified Flavobacterium]KIA97800.1 hypothetical protein OA93_12545 [Flavobacterium sp. KMS]KIC03866.1 hypothetical protein OA88_01860 [Flavobacterium sp. JRM]MEA9413772.1 hypothetical protein [Flavobacterium sp. PL02]